MLALAVTGCGSDSGERAADDPAPSSTSASTSAAPSSPIATPSTLGPIPDLTVATTGEQPCTEAKRAELDEAIANGGVWMPNADLARMDDLVDAWLCGSSVPALQWEDVTIVFLPDAPKGSARAYFRDAVDRLGRGRIASALGTPALVLDADGDQACRGRRDHGRHPHRADRCGRHHG